MTLSQAAVDIEWDSLPAGTLVHAGGESLAGPFSYDTIARWAQRAWGLHPIVRVRAWRVPNEDRASWSVVLRRAPPCDVRAAPARPDAFGRVDLRRRFFDYKWAD